MTLLSICYENGKLKILNALLLPHESIYEEINSVEDAWKAIKEMKVRGAPMIAIVGCLSVAVELRKENFDDIERFREFMNEKLSYLTTARPTAVNMSKSAKDLVKLVDNLIEEKHLLEKMKSRVLETIEQMLHDDITDNKQLSEFGAKHILSNSQSDKITILTHCNTGSLATAGYGTALGVVRALHETSNLEIAYCTETRPYNQGARLTAYEFVHDNIPSTLICDSMVGLLMDTKEVSAVVVGADRVARNGDTANKIGTYQIAVLAKHHGIPFYVAAPVTCHDTDIHEGNSIVIEERPHHELIKIADVKIAPEGIKCWNPAFDITPHHLITGGIITEHGVFTPEKLHEIHHRENKE